MTLNKSRAVVIGFIMPELPDSLINAPTKHSNSLISRKLCENLNFIRILGRNCVRVKEFCYLVQTNWRVVKVSFGVYAFVSKSFSVAEKYFFVWTSTNRAFNVSNTCAAFLERGPCSSEWCQCFWGRSHFRDVRRLKLRGKMEAVPTLRPWWTGSRWWNRTVHSALQPCSCGRIGEMWRSDFLCILTE